MGLTLPSTTALLSFDSCDPISMTGRVVEFKLIFSLERQEELNSRTEMGCTNSKEDNYKNQGQAPRDVQQSQSQPSATDSEIRQPTKATEPSPTPAATTSTNNGTEKTNSTKTPPTNSSSPQVTKPTPPTATPSSTTSAPIPNSIESALNSDIDAPAPLALPLSSETSTSSPRKPLTAPFSEPPIDMNAPLIPDSRHFHDIYELGEEIGQGAFSTVRLGIHRLTKEKCAVKCISKQRIPLEDEIALKQEVLILSALNHPNILKCYGFFDENEFYYLVMEYMAGGELFDRIVQKTFYSEKEARDVVYILLSTIHYCHIRNIVHRDLKPENLLLSNSDDDAFIKLADFGFAISSQGGFSTLKTQCGTPGYVAPEILSTQPYGKAVDMWSIGVITYIMLGGYPPFYDDNQKVLFEKIKKGDYSFHPEYWDAVSVEAKDLISRLLKVNPLERYTSEEALNHSWVRTPSSLSPPSLSLPLLLLTLTLCLSLHCPQITRDASELAQRSLDSNLSHFKNFHGTRKFKAAARAVSVSTSLLCSHYVSLSPEQIISINRMRNLGKK
jgi:calcium/calmodulin-dependent protein kinase I